MKYRNKKIVLDGITFDSKKEANRYAELKLMERAGEIKNLDVHVPFVLIPTQRDEQGRVVELDVKYYADFIYNDKAGKLICEDVKGYKKGSAYAIFAIKRKLMLRVHHIRVREV